MTWFRARLNREGGAGQPVTFSSSFSNDLATDSLDLVEIIVDLENEFAIEINGDNALAIDTVGDAVCFVRRFKSEPTPLASIRPHEGVLVAPVSIRFKLSRIFNHIRKPR